MAEKSKLVLEMERILENKVFVDRTNGILYIPENEQLNTSILNYETYLRNMGQIKEVRSVDYAQITKMQKRFGSKNDSKDTATLQDAMTLFKNAVEKKASDIHIRKHEDYADVKVRIDGRVTPFAQWPAEYAFQLCSVIYGSMADVAEPYFAPTNPQNARIAKPEMLPEGLNGIRISSVPKVGGFFMALRLLYDDSGVEWGDTTTRLQHLGYSDTQTRVINYMRQRPSGINILAGPTGSGKSTTQKHILESLAIERPDLNIMTIEDPPEYPMLGVVQVPAEVSGKGSRDDRAEGFNTAIKAALRSDPDIIMVGEIRDPESAHLALQAAMTGHQVWTTLHANSAFAVISRMADLLGDKISNPMTVLADNSCLTGLVYQRLVVKLCPHCKCCFADMEREAFRSGPYSQVMTRLSQLLDLRSLDTNICFKSEEGCEHCNYKGETGRTVLSEVVAPDPEMLRLVREKATVFEAQRHWKEKQGGTTILQHALEKIKTGQVDPLTVEKALGPLTADKLFDDGVLEDEEIHSLYDNESKELNRILEEDLMN